MSEIRSASTGSQVVSCRLSAEATEILRAVRTDTGLQVRTIISDLLDVAVGLPPRDPTIHQAIRSSIKRQKG